MTVFRLLTTLKNREHLNNPRHGMHEFGDQWRDAMILWFAHEDDYYLQDPKNMGMRFGSGRVEVSTLAQVIFPGDRSSTSNTL
jgi:hypothetical protein